MKNIVKPIIALLTIALLTFTSCQVEKIILNDPSGKTLDSMSPLADLVSQTTMNDGSIDNIIDNSSCITVVLPVTVVANGSEIVISSTEDYKLIERIFDESSTDNDLLEIIFPINVVLADFSELLINDYEELEDVTEDCLEGGDDIDIECIDFKYPISISLYDANNQVSDVINFNNDEELNEFMDDIEDNVVLSFNFPITMILSDSTESVVNTNEELEALINDVEDSCNEDDDDDYDDDDIDHSELNETMRSTAWRVNYYFDIDDNTSLFEGFVFNFLAEEKANAKIDGNIIEGEWETYGDDGRLEVEFEFDYDLPLELLDEDWYVSDYDDTMIELSNMEEDSTFRYLTLEKTEDTGGVDPTIADYIVNGDWEIALFKDDGIDETLNYQGYKIDFAEDLNLSVTNGDDTFSGSWDEEIEPESHMLKLEFSSTQVFEKLNEDWDVVTYTESRIELIKIDSGSETTDNLILEKL